MKKNIEEIKELLKSLSGHVNACIDWKRVHRDNRFNKIFSVVISSYDDVAIIAERLEDNTDRWTKIESEIQKRNKKEDKEKISSKGQELRKEADKLTRQCKADFKSLYVFSKVFLDHYIKLVSLLLPQRHMENKSVTKFFHSLDTYPGNDLIILDFRRKCLPNLKSIDIFLTSYRDDFVIHGVTEKISGTWFINEMDGNTRFLNPSLRPSITPREVILVNKYFVESSVKFLKEISGD